MTDIELVVDLFEDEVQGEILAFLCCKEVSFEDE